MNISMIVGNDEKIGWDDSGNLLHFGPGKDTICFLDISDPESPAIVHTMVMENSIIGPPVNMAIHPNGKLALLANAVTQVKVGDGWKPVPDNKLYVFDLEGKVPEHIATVQTSMQPSGLSISNTGDLALVTNRAGNSISVLSLSGKEVTVVDTVEMGDSVAHVAITPDGSRALAIKPLANSVALLEIDGRKVTYNGYDMLTGLFPYNVDITPDGTLAIVANNGDGGNPDGNVDTAAVIDMAAEPPRVIDHVVVGDAPEGFAISPTGDFAVAVLLRANADKKAFFYNKSSCVVGFKIDGKTMTKTNEVEVGGVAEGVGFSPDGKYLYAANYLDSDISILRVEGAQLIDTGKRMALPGRPAALRMAPA